MTTKVKSLGERLLDGADLLIDFATLGEYGLEPARHAPGRENCRPEPCGAPLGSGPVRIRDAIRRFEQATA